MPIDRTMSANLVDQKHEQRTIGQFKAIGDHSYGAGGRAPSVDLVGQFWSGAEHLQIAVQSVREVDVPIARVDVYIVEGIPLPSIVVV